MVNFKGNERKKERERERKRESDNFKANEKCQHDKQIKSGLFLVNHFCIAKNDIAVIRNITKYKRESV